MAVLNSRNAFTALRDLRTYWKTIIVILIPILLSPLLFSIDSQQAKCAYVVLVMACFWCTEALPLAITAFLPSFMYPLLGIMTAKDAINFLLIGGLIVALAVEEVNLHERIALRVLLFMGSDPRWIILGFMLTAAFLSMWMSNTATAGMMLPIAVAVINELVQTNKVEDVKVHPVKAAETVIEVEDHQFDDDVVNMDKMPEENPHIIESKDPEGHLEELTPERFRALPKRDQRIAKAILLSICYACNIGGTATVTGTTPNVIVLGQLAERASPSPNPLNYGLWIAFQLPFMIMLLLLAWLALLIMFFGMRAFTRKKQKNADTVTKVLRAKYNSLGNMSYGEWSALTLFVLLVVFWLTRDPKFVDGWQETFKPGYITDSVPAMVAAFLCFVLPRERPDWLCWRKDILQKPQIRQSLVTWKTMEAKFPWHVILIMGGGLSMAKGISESGLSQSIGNFMHDSFEDLSPALLQLIVIVFTTFTTEFTSNASTTIVLAPIMIELGVGLSTNPLYFALPTTLACSFAFMLPVATPPNAIVFGTKMLRVSEMALAGLAINILAILTCFLNFNTYSVWLLDLKTFPDWAQNNVTTTTVSSSTFSFNSSN